MSKGLLEKPRTEPKVSRRIDEEAYFEFYNLEEPGLVQKFSYGTTKNYKKYTFFHGEKYKVSREIAEHVESRQTPIWGYRPDGSGRLEKHLKGYKPRFQMREVRD